MIWFSLTDENNEPIDTILFEPAYQYNFTKTKLIHVISDLSNLEDVTISPVSIDQGLIPFNMQEASLNSKQYVQLSMNNEDFFNELYIPEINKGVPFPLYVRLYLPDYAIEGNFVCGLNVQATYYG